MFKINRLEFQKTADITAYFMVLLSVFFLPVSTSINALFVVAALIALLGLKFSQHSKQLRAFNTSKWTFVLILLFFVGVIYSSAPFAEALNAFKKYGFRLMAFVVLAPLFCRSKSRYYVFYTVIAASILYSFMDILDGYHLITIENIFHKPKHVFLSPLPFGLFCAFSSLLTLFFLCTYTNLKKTFSVLLGYQLIYLFFINEERTALIVFIAMAFVFLVRKLPFKKRLLMALPTLLLIITVGFFSSVMKHRAELVLQDIKAYQKGEVHTSIGLRVEYLIHSFKLIKENPLLGSGTGSFSTEYKKTGGPNVTISDTSLGDPHNSYVHIWVQLGFVGLIAFLGWLYSQWQFSTRLMSNEKILLRCFLLAFMLSSLSESSFYRSRNANLYLVMAVVCMGNVFQPRRKIRRYYKKR